MLLLSQLESAVTLCTALLQVIIVRIMKMAQFLQFNFFEIDKFEKKKFFQNDNNNYLAKNCMATKNGNSDNIAKHFML